MNKPHSLQDWQNLAQKSLRDKALSSLVHASAGGLNFDPLYHQRPDVQAVLHAAPLTRWDNRLSVLGSTTQEQNNHALKGLCGGISSLQFTLQSQSRASASSPADFSNLLNDVQLDIAPISLFAAESFSDAAAALTAHWQEQGLSLNNMIGSFNADPIGTLAAQGHLDTGLDNLLTELGTLANNTIQRTPKAMPVCVNTCVYHNAGATMAQELASAIATAVIYMQTMAQHGIADSSAASMIVFQFAADADHIANVTKFRALKQLWHHVQTQLAVPVQPLNLVVETSKRMLSKREPWVNHLRNVSAVAAAAMGGAQSIVVHPHNRVDEQLLDDDSAIANRVARNLPIIMADEAALTFVHDPMAGAYSIEQLTTQLTASTWALLQELESSGGLVINLENGDWQTAIRTAHAARITQLQEQHAVCVGVNRFNEAAVQHGSVSHINPPNNERPGTEPLHSVREASAFELDS